MVHVSIAGKGLDEQVYLGGIKSLGYPSRYRVHCELILNALDELSDFLDVHISFREPGAR